MMQSATYVTVSAGALALLVVVALLILCPVTFGDLSNERKFTLSVQGKNRCPDFRVTGRVVVSRSHLECASRCTIWSECLHYGYHRNNGSCTLYSMTPANLYPADDCVFMLVSRFGDKC